MLYPLVRRLLFLLDTEVAHKSTLKTLKFLDQIKLLKVLVNKIPSRPCKIMDINFEHPIGLAAGFDKNGEYINCLATLGFSHIEIGTVTPKPQPGNPIPRLFRLTNAEAIINRMGFNNNGVDVLIHNVKASKYQGILGINIGKNADTQLENAIDDYQHCLNTVYPYASYVVVNISSPNTPGLRNLQNTEYLNRLIFTLKHQQDQLANQYNKYVPLVFKIAPDLSFEDLKHMAHSFSEYRIDGIIATNTTVSREGVLGEKFANEQGGLSGKPLFNRATRTLEQMNQLVSGKIPIIASGGILSLEDAQQKMDSGASLLQIYTGFVYKGPYLIYDCAKNLEM